MSLPSYKIVTEEGVFSYNLEFLERKVREQIDQGYVPVGGIMFHDDRYHQAMVLREAAGDTTGLPELIESFHALTESINRMMDEKGEPHQAPRASSPSKDD